MTKLCPSNTWCTGGGWWTIPVIGMKSETLNVYGYRHPSQPTTSKGWCGTVWTDPANPDGPAPRCLTYTSTSVASTCGGSDGPCRSRSQYGACSSSWPNLDR